MWEGLVLGLLRRAVRQGRLTVTMPDGKVHTLGDGSGEAPQVAIALTDPDLPRKLVLNPDLALGEAYMDGRLTIENDDLYGLLVLGARAVDRHDLPWINRAHERLREIFRRLMQWNALGRSRRNVAHHYDLSEEFYTLFLDQHRQYTCAYWREPEYTLEQAQLAKMNHIARKLMIRPGMRVLDIGSGFGTLAIHLAKHYGARVTGVTLSQTQIEAARARAAAEGLSDRVEFRFQDYREVTDSFDRIVSVGMMEHVGVPHYASYFGQISDRLTEDGVALIHTIGRSDRPSTLSPWFNKYVFPGGYCPALSEVMPAVQNHGLVLADLEVWRGHYERTLREWRRRFEANLTRVREMYDERLVRMWRYYLIGAELSFTEFHNVVFQLQLSKRPQAVPMTRDYLYGQ